MEFSEKLIEVFNVLDKNDSKTIPISSLGKGLRASGLNPTESQLKEYVDGAELLNGNFIDFKEFEKIANKCKDMDLVTKDEVIGYFESFDLNREDYLSYEDLKKALCTSGDKLEGKDIDILMKDFDHDNSGRINIRDFVEGLFNS
ncbi:hypothetical protein SteCoe_33030 [Stentor coeruleus]|uniref:Calmodulin n=1 Tax=Stentor coeruleus TaxID=5963 RepID=A0A1R2AXP7_9CILI|nr:hypothetical protein SteCoe_33030 [Stentor coeruleus]